jgi:hypothetical protein
MGGLPTQIEGGLFKRAQFREGAHTAHGNHRSKTVYRMIVGVCPFDPRGIWGSKPTLDNI